MVPTCDPQSSAPTTPDVKSHGGLTLSKRGTRTSFTFRKIRHEPCRCGENLHPPLFEKDFVLCHSTPSSFLTSSLSPAFPSACDSQKASVSASGPSLPSLPSCHSDAAHLEKEYVHRVYDAIASHFSSTRHSPWPRVCDFLSSLSPGSVLADVGCGNGKYLGINPQLVAVSTVEV